MKPHRAIFFYPLLFLAIIWYGISLLIGGALDRLEGDEG